MQAWRAIRQGRRYGESGPVRRSLGLVECTPRKVGSAYPLGIENLSRRRFVYATLLLVCTCAQVCVTSASSAEECAISRGHSLSPTFPIRLFGGVIRVPVEYTLYGDEALSRSGARLLEFHVLSNPRASLSIGNVMDTGGALGNLPVLCTVGALTVRQRLGPSVTATVVHDDKYYVSMISADAEAWRGLLGEFVRSAEVQREDTSTRERQTLSTPAGQGMLVENLVFSHAERETLLRDIVLSPVIEDGRLYGSRLRMRPNTDLAWPTSWREDDTIVAINGQLHPNGRLILDELRTATEVELIVESPGQNRRTVRIRFDLQ